MKAIIVIRKANEILFHPTDTDWNLNTFHIVKVTKRTVTCNCTIFKASFGKAVCPHTEVIKPHVKKGRFAWQGILKSADSVLMQDRDIQTMDNDVGIYYEGA